MERFPARLSHTPAGWHEIVQHTTSLAYAVRDEVVLWSGHDILTVPAMPGIEATRAFSMVVSAEAGLQVVDLTPPMPMDHAVQAMAAAKAAVSQTGHAAPGRTKLSSPDKLAAGGSRPMDAGTLQPQP